MWPWLPERVVVVHIPCVLTYLLTYLLPRPRAGVARKRRDTRGRGGVCRANPVVLVTGARWAVTAAVAGAPTWCRVCLRPF